MSAAEAEDGALLHVWRCAAQCAQLAAHAEAMAASSSFGLEKENFSAFCCYCRSAATHKADKHRIAHSSLFC